MKIIPSSYTISSLEFCSKKDLIVSIPFKDDLLPITSDRKYSITDRAIYIFKIFVHPKGSNIIYPLSRKYLYSLKQTYYTKSHNRLTFISSFGDMSSALRFICKRSIRIFNSLKSYEELWLLRGHVPIGSLVINTRSADNSKYVESSSITLDIEDHYNTEEIFEV